MRNRVHGLSKLPTPFLLELVCLSDIRFRRLCAYSGFFMEPIEAWLMSVQAPGDEHPTVVHVWDSRDRN